MAKDYASLPAPLGTLGDTSTYKFQVQFLVFLLLEPPGGEERSFILKHYILMEGEFGGATAKLFGAEEHLRVVN